MTQEKQDQLLAVLSYAAFAKVVYDTATDLRDDMKSDKIFEENHADLDQITIACARIRDRLEAQMVDLLKGVR